MAGTYVSQGYAGTVGEVEWAQQLPYAGGSDYSVHDVASHAVSIVTAADRTVKVTAGPVYGRGVRDVLAADTNVQLDAAAAGQTRFDLLVVRRRWSPPGGTTTLEIVKGTPAATNAVTDAVRLSAFVTRKTLAAAATTASAAATADSAVDEQPIALVQVVAGQQNPVIVADLRCWHANGGLVAAHDYARQYLVALGTQVRIGDVLWSRVQDAVSGAATWSSWQPSSMYGAIASLAGALMQRHMETVNGAFAVASSQPWGLEPQTLAVDVNRPGEVSGAGVRVSSTGLYALQCSVSLSGSMTGRRFVELRANDSTLARVPFTGDTDGSVAVPAVRLTDGDLVTGVIYQDSGEIRTVSSRLRVTRLAGA